MDQNGTSIDANDATIIVEVIFMSVILSAALIGNICLCWVILSDEKLRCVPNKLVLNLAICGLFAVITNGPFILLTIANGGNWIFGDVLCQINGFTTSTYGLASILTLAVISVNRFQMIRRTTKTTHMWFTERRVPFLLSGVWIFSSLLSLPPMIGWSTYSFIDVRAICTLQWSTDLTYTTFMFTLGIFTPFAAIFVAYFCICNIVRNNFKRMRAHQRQSSFRHHQSRGKYKSRKNVQPNVVIDVETPEANTKPTVSKSESVPISIPTYVTKSTMDICILPIDNEYCNNRPGSLFMTTSKYHLHHDTEGNNTSEISWQSYFADDLTPVNVVNKIPDEQSPQTKEDGHYAANINQVNKCTKSVNHLGIAVSCCAEIQHEFESERSFSSNTSSVLSQTADNANLHPVDVKVRKNKSRKNKHRNIRISIPSFKSLPWDDLRLTAMVFVVLASFILCWAPITIINFIETVLDSRVSRLMNMIAVYMMYLSAALNPVIYGLMNRNSRRAFNKIFCGWTKRFKNTPRKGKNKIADIHGQNNQVRIG